MECPDCKGRELESVLSKQGVEVDYCQECHGVWLDRGEIYLLARRPEIVSKRLKEADKISKKQIISPKTNTAMTPINYPEGTEIYICDSGGIWIDGKQIDKFRGSDDNINIDLGLLVSHEDDMKLGLNAAVGYPGTFMDNNNSDQVPNRWIKIVKKAGVVVLLSIVLLWVYFI